MSDQNQPESGVRDLRARQLGTKMNPWQDGNGPAEEGSERTEADWQEAIAQGQRPAGTSRRDTGHDEQGVAGPEAAEIGDLHYQPSANQVRDEPIPASHHADRGDETTGGDGEDDTRG